MESISEADQLSRCIIYNSLFCGDLHTDSELWIFGKRDQNGVSHQSGVLRRLAPEDKDVHAIGCSIAALQNVAKAQPPPGETRRYYCGFRTALVRDLTLESPGRFCVELSCKEENGVAAHVDVALTVYGATKQVAANQRTEAGMTLASAFGAPVAHVCGCDADDHLHPLKRWGLECLTSGLNAPVANLTSAGDAEKA